MKIEDIYEMMKSIPFVERQDLDVTLEFFEELKRLFPPVTSYPEGSIGALGGIDVYIVEDLPIPWRFREHT